MNKKQLENIILYSKSPKTVANIKLLGVDTSGGAGGTIRSVATTDIIGVTETLDQVTTAGNTTTNDITVGDLAADAITGDSAIVTGVVSGATYGTAAPITDAELGYVDGVTSAIQGQIDDKAPIADPTFTGEIGIGAINVSETELGILEGATLSTTELNYVDGVTSNIQTQLDTPFTFGTDIVNDFTLTITEQNTYIDVDKATAITVTVPKNTYATGDSIILEQTGAGQVTVAPIDGDVTLTGGLKTFAQYNIVQLIFKSANIVNIVGGTNV